jgi:UPF0176 protein
MSEFVVCALYKFVRLPDYRQVQEPLREVMLDNQVRGTLLLAAEGINGTICGSREAIDIVLDWLRAKPEFTDLECKESLCADMPFKRTRVKIKKEIVTMGVEGIDPQHSAGTYVEARDWNQLIADPDVLLIDTRNDYECKVGRFPGSVNPSTETFREFPQYVRDNLDPAKHKKVAMYCTGGIRCEKSTALLKQQGFEEVYHLKGGILKYLENVPVEESVWEGECFVFDDRVTVTKHLEPGSYDQCHACRRPITEEDKQSALFLAGVSCPQCHAEKSAEQKTRFAEREKQMRLSKLRGEVHIGADAAAQLQKRRALKKERTSEE